MQKRFQREQFNNKKKQCSTSYCALALKSVFTVK